MIRAAAVAAVLIPAVAHADPPGMTPPVEPGSVPIAPAPPPTAWAPPAQTYTPSYYPAPPSGPISEQPQPPAAPGTPSYRGLTIAVDLAALAFFAGAVDNNNEDLLVLSIGTYALGAPLVHAMKGRTGNALASAGMRVGLPLLGAMLGDAMAAKPKCYDYNDYCDQNGDDEAVIGAILGIGAAMVIDTAYLAKGDKPRPQPQPQWNPTIRASQSGFALGAAGTF